FAVTVKDPHSVRRLMERAFHEAQHGRKGPVFVEIPLDVQSADVNPDALEPYWFAHEPRIDNKAYLASKAKEVSEALSRAERPLVIVGNGVRLANAIDEFRGLFDHYGVPVVSSWGAADIMPNGHPYYIGRCGIFGDRASNFAVQTADLTLPIGTRPSVAKIGHATQLFAPQALKIIVDVDAREIFQKPTVKVDIGVVADAKEFLEVLRLGIIHHSLPTWTKHCMAMKDRYARHLDVTKSVGI